MKVNIIGWLLRKVGLLPIEKVLHLDATEESGTADQSTKVNILMTSLTGDVAEPSTKVKT